MRVGPAKFIISFSLSILILFSIGQESFSQNQFQIRQMRNSMSVNLEKYSFGFSWDNRTAFDSLNQLYLNSKHLIDRSLNWKNRPSNSVEKEYLRLLSNYGVSVLDRQVDKDPLVELLLEFDPYLIPDQTDNYPELENQIKLFYPLPSLKAGIKFGFNYNSRQNQGVAFDIVQNSETQKSYSSELGWQIAFPLTYLLLRNHSISLEPGISYSNIDITNEFLGSSQTFKYRIYYLDLPIVYRFSLLNPRLNGFNNIGSYNGRISDKLGNKILVLEDKIEKVDEGQSARLQRRMEKLQVRQDHINMNTPYERVIPYFVLGLKPKFRISSFVDSNNSNELTNWVQLEAVTGLGFEWYKPRNTFSLEFRYNHGLLNVNTKERYYVGGEVTGLLFNDFYVSDDFRLQIFEISFIANYILSHKANKIR